MRRLIVLVSAVALLASLAPVASARHVSRPSKGTTTSAPPSRTEASPQRHYPPGPGPDAAVTGIFAGTLTTGQYNTVIVEAENHGGVGALVAVSLRASSDRFRAIVRPGVRRIWLEPGDSLSVAFRVRPRRPGTYELVACATAFRPREVHPQDDCMAATATAV